ncbi:MAG TPA: LPS export ABC transporter permease LptF [Candidatus Thioglobus sp.]|nr:LPS export ABC transporter permease LptF [Candidatus Thioglobus sp.]HIL20947.1 LPS export ABC transporter permease LptF [Candidatus Thioglobus sp.]
MKTNLLRIIQYQNSRIARYLMRNVSVLFFAMIFIIGLVVFGNQFVLMVKESVRQGILIQELLPLIGFNMIRDVPLIFSLSLFLAIILTVSQLYKSSEAIVLNSLGLGDKHFMLFIQPVVILATLFVFFLTTSAVPWAKEQKNLIVEESKNASEFSFIKEGEFQEFKDGEIVFYASESSTPDDVQEQNMEEIFIYASAKGRPLIVLASEATKYTDPDTRSVYLRLKDGVRYQGIPSSENISILEFDQYDLQIISGEAQESEIVYTKIEGRSTLDLLSEQGNTAAAELQWRFSQPLSVLILSALGVLLGKASPRGGKGIGLLIGVGVFVLYNNGLLMAKGALERGEINAWIGLWWIHLLVIVLIIILYQFRHGNLSTYLVKIPNLYTKEKSNA